MNNKAARKVIGGALVLSAASLAGWSTRGWWSAGGSSGPAKVAHPAPVRKAEVQDGVAAAPLPTPGAPARLAEVAPAAGAPEFIGPGATAPPEYYPRDADEWQGRLVEVSTREPCNDFGGCGRGRACVEGVCGPCKADADCMSGEACVLNNCVSATKVNCRSRKDCPTGSLCMLVDDGTASGWRGNAGLVAVCSGSDESKAIPRHHDAESPGSKTPAAPDPVSMSGLAPGLSELLGRELRTVPIRPEGKPDEE